MKNRQRHLRVLVLFTVSLLMLGLYTLASAGEELVIKPFDNSMEDGGPMERGFKPPGHMLCMAIQDSIAAEILVGLTGKSVEAIESEISETHMMEVLSNNSIDPDAFMTAMDLRMNAAAEQAAECGLITSEQAAEIVSSTDSSYPSDAGEEFEMKPHNGPMGDGGPMERGFKPPKHVLCMAIQDSIAVEILVELTGKSVEEIESEMSETHMMEVLSNNSIDPDIFKAGMDLRMNAASQQAAECGLITSEQAAEIVSAANSSCTSETEYVSCLE